ncbi:MAG TPA: AAA family ATPase [Gallionellaceae bacterium]
MKRSRASNNQPQLIAALLDPRRGLLGAQRVRLIETHISWVLLAGRFAYKIKKAVDLGFLDFTTLRSRRFYCEEEIRLNRRLAPQLYLEALPISGSPEHPVLGPTRSGQPAFEYAVKMRRFAPNNLLDKLLSKGLVTPQHMDQLAALLAGFHHNLPPALPDSSYGAPASILAAALQNFEQMQPLLADVPPPNQADLAQLATIRQLTAAEFSAHENDFAARRAQGLVRECHGDLHLGNIALIRGKPVPFDGIEFSPALRWEDIVSEIAFPVMDLQLHGQPALAFRLLNAWLEAGGDYAGICVLRFYLAYRAMVRAKISAIRAAQPGLAARAKTQALAACLSYMALAEQTLTQRHPALIITHGLPGSGKTTFAQLALEKFCAIRIRSDVERKRLFGLSPLESSRAGADIYSQEATRRTYARLRDLARTALAAGYPVIVDAAFLRRDERTVFRTLADEIKVPFAIASLQASDAALRARIAQRQAGARDASEADIGVLNLLQAAQEPLDTREENCIEFKNGEDQAGYGQAQWRALGKIIAGKQAP